jgi:hypothetical protein
MPSTLTAVTLPTQRAGLDMNNRHHWSPRAVGPPPRMLIFGYEWPLPWPPMNGCVVTVGVADMVSNRDEVFARSTTLITANIGK